MQEDLSYVFQIWPSLIIYGCSSDAKTYKMYDYRPTESIQRSFKKGYKKVKLDDEETFKGL